MVRCNSKPRKILPENLVSNLDLPRKYVADSGPLPSPKEPGQFPMVFLVGLYLPFGNVVAFRVSTTLGDWGKTESIGDSDTI